MTTPREWIITGCWPTGLMATDAPLIASKLKHAALVVDQELRVRGWTRSQLAEEARVDLDELDRFTLGIAVPSLELLAQLEARLHRNLWP